MIRINIHEAKVHFSKYIARVRKGETIVLCSRNEPIAEIRPLPSKPKRRRPVGLAKGRFKVPPEFFEPLPEEELRGFYGEDE
jgi:prevent-host-death family protein